MGGIFGAYLTDPPKPGPSFYGTGECFLWRAALLPASSNQLLMSNLPPPPSAPEADEGGMVGRSTTIRSPTSPVMGRFPPRRKAELDLLTGEDEGGIDGVKRGQRDGTANGNANGNGSVGGNADGTATPSEQLLRFKAFPYSGVNDYLIFCEPTFLSVGGGDGRYGLWLDGNMERGVSGQCMTFGNEPLSEEGEKFEIVGVEVWCVGGG